VSRDRLTDAGEHGLESRVGSFGEPVALDGDEPGAEL
jgi:hypothetical protein